MRIRSWLSTCSTTTSTATCGGDAPSLPKFLISDSSSPSSDTQTQSSNSSLQSNLSLLTLPSVPSLQKLLHSPQNAAVKPSANAIALTSLTPHRRAHINFLTLHNDLLYAAVGTEIHVYQITSNTLFQILNAGNEYSGAVKSIAFSDGKIFTAHQDCKIRVWKLNDQKQHKLISTLPTLEDRLKRLLFPQNYVRVRRHKKKLWIEHHDAVSGLETFENDGPMCNKNLVLSISWDKSIKIWQVENFHCQESINRAHQDAINAAVISKDGLIYTGSADKKIKVWKKEGKKFGLIATLEKHKSAVNALTLNFDGSVLFSGSCDRSILVWEREDSANHMAVTGALRGHAKAILCLVNVQDMLFSGSGDRTVRIWQRGFDGRYCCLKMLDHQAPVRSLVASVVDSDSGDGGIVKVFSGSFDGEIKVWQVEVGKVDYD